MSQLGKQVESASGPWWKYGHVWMVLAGPAIVVVAGIVTAMIAMDGADPVVDPNYYQEGLKINQKLEKAWRLQAPCATMLSHLMKICLI